MKIIQKYDKCIGCGCCVSLCPQYWEITKEGKVNLKGAKINTKNKEQELEIKQVGCNQEAADSCPVQCIYIKD